MELTDAKTLNKIIKEHNFKFSKQLGQNFLVDHDVLAAIIDTVGVCPHSGIVEIGCGVGTMTRELASCCAKVVAFEIDKTLMPILNHTVKCISNVKIINDDILKVNLERLFALEFNDVKDIKMVANLPYYITTPIVMTFLECSAKQRMSSITIMLQKEVAERMAAKPGTKNYGALTIAVQYHANVSVVRRVSPHCFIPQPTVHSVVLNLNILPQPSVIVKSETTFFKVVKAAFCQRRKILINSLSSICDKTTTATALRNIDLAPNTRGETLTLAQFALLADYLTTRII